MTPTEEYLTFDVVIHHTTVIDNRLAGIVTYNRPASAANDEQYGPEDAA